MLKNRCPVRCMFFLLAVFGVFLPGYLKAVEYKFTRSWLAPALLNSSNNPCVKRHTANGVIIKSNNGNDDGILRFRLEYRPSISESPHYDHPECVNTQLSVELQPRNLVADEQALLQQVRSRVPEVDPQEDPVDYILNTLSSADLTTSFRRTFISVMAGGYDAQITGFGEAETTTVVGVSCLEDLIQLLLILKSKLSEDQFNQLVNAVVQLRIPCFLPEAMGFNQLFPLVHFAESQNNNPIDVFEGRTTTYINLYTDPAMSTVTSGRLILTEEEDMFLVIGDDVRIEANRLHFVRQDSSRPFCAPATLNRWNPPEVERREVMPARPGNFVRFPSLHSDSGYSSNQAMQ